MSFADTVAPTTTAPEESCTVPCSTKLVPAWPCAAGTIVSDTNRHATTQNIPKTDFFRVAGLIGASSRDTVKHFGTPPNHPGMAKRPKITSRAYSPYLEYLSSTICILQEC